MYFTGALELILVLHILTINAEICSDDICEYDFVIEFVETMVYRDGYNTYSVKSFGHELKIVENSWLREEFEGDIIGRVVNSSDVLTGDGVHRTVISVNKQFPGPAIEVMEGSQIVVRVKNKLFTDALSVHWHGLHQRGTPWMDGDGHISQCPILPDQSFTYRFIAEPAGTHFYHAHYSNLGYDGLFGAILIHKHPPKHEYFIANIFDWFHYDGSEMWTLNPYTSAGSAKTHHHMNYRDYMFDNNELSAMKYVSAMVNGRGRYNDNESLPLETFDVVKGRTYRFYVIHAGFEMHFIVSIDGHQLTLVGVEGGEINPIVVDYVILGPGERVVLDITADQTSNKYWFRVQTLREGTGFNPTPDGIYQGTKAIVRYNDVSDPDDPESQPKECTLSEPCIVFNCPFPAYPIDNHRTCIGVHQVESTEPHEYLRDRYGLREDEDLVEYFYNFGYHFGSSVNGRMLVHPEAPVFVANHEQYQVSCDPKKCYTGCRCTHTEILPYGKTIQLVVSNLPKKASSPDLTHHLIHLHGHDFAILAVGYPDYNTTTGAWTAVNPDVICNNEYCSSPRWNDNPPELNLRNPPIRDTFTVPSRGYVVIRFKANNPGYWPFHCHQLSHFLEGMGMYFNEAPEATPPVPQNFPVCGNFDMTNEEFNEYMNINHIGNDKKRNGKNENKTEVRDEMVTMSLDVAVGVGVALVVLGCIIAIVPFLMYQHCRKRGKTIP